MLHRLNRGTTTRRLSADRWAPLLGLLALALSAAACGEGVDSRQAFLWRVRSATPPTYLLGTIHYGVSAEELPPVVWQAFESSITFVAETDLAEEPTEAEIERFTTLPEGVTLRELVTPEVWSVLREVWADLPAEEFERIHPWALEIALQNALVPPWEEIMDDALTRQARQTGKAVAFLETFAAATAPIREFPLEDSVRSLIGLLADPEAYIAGVEQLLALYRQGDVGAMRLALWGTEGEPEPNVGDEQLLAQRNRLWFAEVERYARQGGAFIAVGLAHLIGPDSLLRMLREQGVEVERVAPLDDLHRQPFGDPLQPFNLDAAEAAIAVAFFVAAYRKDSPVTIISWGRAGDRHVPCRTPARRMQQHVVDLGRFRLAGALGVDPVGHVYRAEMIGTLDFAKHVVVKVLHPRYAQDPDDIAQLLEESERLAGLQSSKVVNVFEAGRRQGMCYLALEHVEGWNLQQLMTRCRSLGRRFPVTAAAYVVGQLTAALRELSAHDEGLVHGSITPAHVFITRGGHIKLGDCCSAHLIARAARTPADLPRELLPYLAPEQARGDDPGPHSDVYALALVLFELLTGCPLNSGSTPETLLESAINPPELLPSNIVDGAAPLDDAVRVALDRRPTARSSAHGLGSRLKTYLEGRPFDAAAMAEFCDAVEHLMAQRALAEAVEGQTPSQLRTVINRRRETTPYDAIGLGASDAAPRGYSTSSRDLSMAPGHAICSEDEPSEVEELALEASPDDRDLAGRGRAANTPVRQPGRRSSSTGWPVRAALSALGLVLVGGAALYLGTWRSPVAAPGPDALVPGAEPRAAQGAAKSAEVSGAADETSALKPRGPERAGAAESDHARRLSSDRHQVPAPTVVEPAETHGRTDDAPAVDPPSVIPVATTETAPPEPRAPRDLDLLMRNKEVHQLVKQARERGLMPGDDPLFDRYRREAKAWAGRENGGAGRRALTNLRIVVEDFEIDRAFVERKIERLGRAIAASDEARAERLRRAQLSIHRLVEARAFVEASHLISTVLQSD